MGYAFEIQRIPATYEAKRHLVCILISLHRGMKVWFFFVYQGGKV